MSFTEEVRAELAGTTVARRCCRLAELSVLLRLGAVLSLRGGEEGLAYVLDTPAGSVARRVRSAAGELTGRRPPVEVHRPGGIRRTVRYRVRVRAPVALLVELGLVDGSGRPLAGLSPTLARRPCDVAAAVRGAFLAAGSISGLHQAPHLEFGALARAPAEQLAGLVVLAGGRGARSGAHGEGWRVVLKSGTAIGALLARTGAHGAFLRWDEAKLRRELRGQANRAANADSGNLRRGARATARQIAAIERAIERDGWEQLGDELRATALARLANPEASLEEIGALLDPPVAKATVHRRLARVLDLATAPAGLGAPEVGGAPAVSDGPLG